MLNPFAYYHGLHFQIDVKLVELQPIGVKDVTSTAVNDRDIRILAARLQR
jgi:hypothetical protein